MERTCRGWAKAIAVIDDLADRDHDCDVLCDSALDRTPWDYAAHVSAATKLLLGPQYALLRPEFARARHRTKRKSEGPVRRLFVNVGATDPTGLLPKIVDGIELAGFEGVVDIVIAAQAPGRKAVAERLERAAFDGRLHVDADNVAELMAEADLAVGAAGSTAWERCCLGLPSVIVMAADNQRHIAQGLAAAGAAMLLPPDFSADDLAKMLASFLGDKAQRAALARGAKRLCDGLGCGRVAEAMLFPMTDTNGKAVALRPVDDGDKDILLRWQNEPAVRRFARDPRVPGAAEHAAWFAAKLDDTACVFHIVEVAKAPAGFLRLDFHRDEATYEVSIALSEDFHHRGVATAALAIIRRMLPWAELRAWVRPENSSSVGLFRKSGYIAVQPAPGGDGSWLASMPLAARPCQRQYGAPT
jgi:spore coat polysaccharide biosynthesis predicted glycosyltransferase SpsG/RimJ/RimL family protein N-acetyltransferase